jgi:hypothetical protein
VLFCLIGEAYALLNPRARYYEPIKKPADSEVIALTLFQQLRGVESERSFLRDAQRFFPHLFPGVVGLHPSSSHRRVRKLRRFLEPLRREIVREPVGDPETLIVDSALLSVLHLRQVKHSAGFAGAAWVRWGLLQRLRGKAAPHLRHNRVPISYELNAARVTEVRPTEEPLPMRRSSEEVSRAGFSGIWPTAASGRRSPWPKTLPNAGRLGIFGWCNR